MDGLLIWVIGILLILSLVGAAYFIGTGTKAKLAPGWWRDVIARISLPMLAFGASAGVFQFNHLTHFVDDWVAGIIAGSFEMTYIGLAFLTNLSSDARTRARRIAFSAMLVSMIYNILGGFFARNLDVLDGRIWTGDTIIWRLIFELLLAVVHGAPLAMLAYFTSDLVLHSVIAPALQPTQPEVIAPQPQSQQINTAEIAAQVSRSLEAQIAAQINLAVQGVRTDLTRRIDAVASEVGHRIATTTPPQVAPQPKTETAAPQPATRIAPQPVSNPVETALKETAHAFAAAPVPVAVGAVSTGAADSGHDPVFEEVTKKARELELPDPARLTLTEQEEWAYRLKNEYNWYNHQIGKWLGVSENTAKKRWQDYQKRPKTE